MNKKLKFAIFGNVYLDKKSTEVQRLIATARDHGADIAIPEAFYNFVRESMQIDVPECEVIKDNNFKADFVVCLGGDGTFLDVANNIGDKQIPIIGFNTGRLGFLASFAPENIETTIDEIYAGNYCVKPRSVLQLSCKDMDIPMSPYALNEIAILKHDIASMISIHTDIDNEYLTTYQADGLIISTPTGSTAYSLSVGGPIIEPQSGTVSLTPVAPHSLNMRPIVLKDSCEIDLRVESRSHNFLISLDGRSLSVPENLHLHIRRAPHEVMVVTKPGQSFFTTLRRKMMWGADRRR